MKFSSIVRTKRPQNVTRNQTKTSIDIEKSQNILSKTLNTGLVFFSTAKYCRNQICLETRSKRPKIESSHSGSCGFLVLVRKNYCNFKKSNLKSQRNFFLVPTKTQFLEKVSSSQQVKSRRTLQNFS